MSKYDKDREKLGLKSLGPASSPSAQTNKKSKYAAEREKIFTPPKQEEPISSPERVLNDAFVKSVFDLENSSPFTQKEQTSALTIPQSTIQKIVPLDPTKTELSKAIKSGDMKKYKKDLDVAVPKKKDSDAREHAQKWFDDIGLRWVRENILDPYVNTVDAVRETKVGQFSDLAAQSAGKMMGIPENMMSSPASTGNDTADLIAKIVGGAASFAINPAQTEANLVTGGYNTAASLMSTKAGNALANMAYKGASKTADKLNPLLNTQGINITQDMAQKAADRFLRGATAGTYAETAQGAMRGETSPEELAKNALIGGGFGGAGDVAFSALGTALKGLFKQSGNQTAEKATQELLALPAPRQRGNVNIATTDDVIYGTGRVEPLGLPEPNVLPPTRARVEKTTNPYRDKYENLIRTASTQQFTPGKELEELDSLWSQMAGKDDPSLMDLIELAYPKKQSKVTPGMASKAREQQQLRDVYGVPSPVKSLNERYNPEIGTVASPVERVGIQDGVTISPPTRRFASTEQTSKYATEREQMEPVRTTARQSVEQPTSKDEYGFAQTVRTSENTSPELARMLSDAPPLGSRTTDALNQQNAQKIISDHGIEGATSKILSKRTKLSASEVTAAQMLARHYSELGGEENLNKAIEIISKTAREGREMGQAIQALSQWNKLDQEGAILLAQKQLNRGVSDTAEWQKLTPEQAQPVKEAAQRIEQVQITRNLAEEVLNIVTNKKPGAALSDVEKATIQQFHAQVVEVNNKAKSFLPKSGKQGNESIEKIAKTPPKERTRDQVVDYLESKAEKARKRLEARRNVGIVPQLNNPIVDYAIIGASEIAKGVRTYADFTKMMVKQFGQKVEPHMKQVYLKAVNTFRKENGLPTVDELDRVVNTAIKRNQLDEETARSLKVLANEIGFMSDEFKREATQDLQKALKSLGSSTLGEKISTLQTAGQLLSVPTFMRNAIGNVGQIALEKLNKMSAVPIDWAVSKLTGERTIQFLPQNQEKFWRNFMIGTKSGWEGVSPTGTLSSYDIHPEVFGQKNPLRYLTKTLGASLQGMDFAAYRQAYGEVVATYAEQLGKARGLSKDQIKAQMPELIKSLDQRIHDLADQAGLYATYQDDTLLSRATQGVKRSLNKVTDKPVQALVERGLLPKALSTEGFGLGDIVLKYARTPANLVMRGIDYSPIGFVRSLMELMPLMVNKSKFNQYQATRALSRAITGTLGLTGMGYVLADAGILTGAASPDKDMRSIQEQSGQGAYKVNWSALGRWMASGFDKEVAKYQKGDRMMDYAWLQPAAISLAMGVNANQVIKNQKPGEEKTGVAVAWDALVGGLRSVLENPMLQGLSNVVDASTDLIKRQSADKFGDILKGVPASFVPSIVGQGRTSTDNLQRETFDENLLQEMLNIVKNKIPGLSKTLPVSYDSLGKPRQRIQGGDANTLGQYLNAFLSPVKMTEFEVSPDAKMVLDVLNETGDATVLPRMGNRYIMVDEPGTKKQKRIDLTAEQYSKLQRSMGTYTAEHLSRLSNYLSDPNRSAEKKAEKIKDILTKVGQKARNELRVEMGYKKKRE